MYCILFRCAFQQDRGNYEILILKKKKIYKLFNNFYESNFLRMKLL